MRLFGPLHLSLLVVIAALGMVLAISARRGVANRRSVRYVLGCALAANEIGWWVFRYSREGLRFPSNLPLQLCDVTIWTTVFALLTLTPWSVEFSYFAGLAGAGMALITPDLWAPWPSYPAIYFFLAHGGIVIAMAFLIFGRVARLRRMALWRAAGMLLVYALPVGLFDWIFGSNYMYLRAKPKDETILSWLGPWPVYLVPSFALAMLLFWLLWLAGRPRPDATAISPDPTYGSQ